MKSKLFQDRTREMSTDLVPINFQLKTRSELLSPVARLLLSRVDYPEA